MKISGAIGMIEIGSEFHNMKIKRGKGVHFPNNTTDQALLFCGRTAIETVLKNETSIKRAVLPSYCCDSMIQPFNNAGIEVSFYDVCYDNGIFIDLKIEEGIDCIVWCNYFGFKIEMPDLSDFKNNGGIVIEDITHSFFSQEQFNSQSDYLVASLRKWEPILCGGYCASLKGKIEYRPVIYPPESFLKQKRTAMEEKGKYLSGDKSINKNTFLDTFSENNSWLSRNYSSLCIDKQSNTILMTVDQQYERDIRRKNANVLYNGLKSDRVKFLFKQEDMDCPLFVPIIMENSRRKRIVSKLIKNRIYCPIHWPKPDVCTSNLYDMELSLVCDQRYNEKDMERILSVICE